MRTGAARGHVGHFHEAGFYSSDTEFAALIVPFVEEGVAAGEPVIIGYDDRKADLLRSWLADPSAVEFIGDQSLYATPARGWCLYDSTTAPQTVLDMVERTHPRLVSPSGWRRASEHYQEAAVFEGLPPPPDLLEAATPLVELTGRPAADTRHALAQIGSSRIDNATLTDLIIGASEAVSNALRHGQPPATVRIWATTDRIVIKVHDTGPGPADPLAGLTPAAHSTPDPGLGLWVMHQLDIDTALIHASDGFTVRLRAGVMPD